MTVYGAKCADLGMQCSFEIKNENREELLNLTEIHAKETHEKEITPELRAMITGIVKEVG